MRAAILLLVCLALAGSATVARGAEIQTQSGPILFKADQLRHERNLGIVVAKGHVEIVQGERILRAETVTYNQKTNILTANGKVVLLEPSGDVLFADHVELSGDFKNGIIENLRVLMSDNARFAAVGGRRIDGNVTEMRKVVYSPCRSCVSPSGLPIWQLKAVKVTHNQQEHTIEYRDAFMEFYGIPVLYTPYLSHPDPTVKRKSGFLTPRYGSDSNLGGLLEVPYYFNIAPDKDATFRPIFTTDEGVVLGGQYRQRFADGEISFEGSGTYASDDTGEDTLRGHLFGKSRFDLTNTWRTGADVELASDDTYLRRYGFKSTTTLTNRLYMEGFRGRNYASAQGYYWQGQRATESEKSTPIVAPLLDFNAITDVGNAGGRWSFDANLMTLTRTNGTDSRRISLLNGWQLPYIAPTGEVYRLYADLQTDAYFVSHAEDPDAPGSTDSGVTGRVFPRVGLDWRYPFARSAGRTTQIVEPVAGIMLSPNGGNPDKIPNEDSQDIEFDDTNLLSHNRFTGLDRVEGGQRVYYGMQLGAFGTLGESTAFVGQSYRFRRDDLFSEASGLADNFSDIVGRLLIRPNYPIRTDFRFRLDKDNLSLSRSELKTSIGPRAFNVNVNYAFFDQGSGSGEFGNREELTAGFRSQVTKEWSVSGATVRDLERGEARSHRFAVEYKCDCFTMSLSFSRSFTEDRDVKPTDTVFLTLTFKNLGQVGTATSP